MNNRVEGARWNHLLAAACACLGVLIAVGSNPGGRQALGQATQPESPAQTQPQVEAEDTPQAIDPTLENAGGSVAGANWTLPPAITPSTLTDAHVVESMKKGVDFLLSTVKRDNWESGQPWARGGQHGGETALVVYALLHAGESLRDDPEYGPKLNYHSKELAPAVAWLCKLDPAETYTAALLANALSLLPQKPDDNQGITPRAALQRAYRYLFTAMGPQGGYTYGPTLGGRGFNYSGDLSNAQYGALGAWALAQAGIEFPTAYWQTTDRFWRRLQSPSGSWPYLGGGSADIRDSMGVAGIATLFIAQEFTDKTLRSTPLQDRTLDLGLAWLDQSFRADTGDLYYMYGVERVGLASGLKYFGTRDWYRQCAADIIGHQGVDGSWYGASWIRLADSPQTPPGGRLRGRGRVPNDIVPDFNGATATTSTAYALLFLARGRNPILFNKLQYDGPWNARPRDDAFLTRWLGKRFERPLNWQVVNLNVKATEWLDAPILLITGSADPGFTSADIEKLRTFIQGGGMIFSTADDNSAAFTNAIRKYAGQVVAGRYEMRQMPKTHLLFNSDLGADIPVPPALQSMSNGVREIWVHSTVDMGASWQMQRFSNKVNFETPTALYFYATGRMPMAGRLKPLEPSDVVPAGDSPMPEGRSVNLARVVYSGNFEPEPGAWPRLAKVLRISEAASSTTTTTASSSSSSAATAKPAADLRLDLKVSNVAIKDLDPAKYPVAHMTGTARFLQKPEEADALRRYLSAGGTLIADAGGGSEAFAGEFLNLVQRIYPDAELKQLSPDHPLFTGKFAGGTVGEDVTEVTFRRYGATALGKKITQPFIQGITVDGRVRILFSKYDITSGLLGTNTWGIVGYSPESSRKLAANMLRWVIDGRKGK